VNNGEFQAHTEKLEALIQRVNALPDEDARATALELLQSTMDLHGAALGRIVEVLSDGDAGRKSLAELGEDPLVCGLLVLYGVHPKPLEERVAAALEKVRPQLHKNGGGAELLEMAESTVRISIQSTGNGCHSSPDALRQVVEQAIREAAPEIAEIVADGVPAATEGFVPLNTIQPARSEDKNYEESAA